MGRVRVNMLVVMEDEDETIQYKMIIMRRWAMFSEL
jgi:hypothetical protein